MGNLDRDPNITAILVALIGGLFGLLKVILQFRLEQSARQKASLEKSEAPGSPAVRTPPVTPDEARWKVALVWFVIPFVLFGTGAYLILRFINQSISPPISGPVATSTTSAGESSYPVGGAVLTLDSAYPPMQITPAASPNCGLLSTWKSTEWTDVVSQDPFCTVFANWGFTSRDNVISISVDRPLQDTTHAIYTPLGDAQSGRLTIEIDAIQTPTEDHLVNLAVGIVALDRLEQIPNGLIYLQRESPQAGYPVFVKTRERGALDVEDAGYIQLGDGYLRFEEQTSHVFTFSAQADSRIVTLDGDRIYEAPGVDGEAVFWIGYRVPTGGALNVTITGLEFQ